MKMSECKHEIGWIVKDVSVYVFDDGRVTLNFNQRKGVSKLLAQCNRIGCNKKRFIYISANEVRKFKWDGNSCYAKVTFTDNELKLLRQDFVRIDIGKELPEYLITKKPSPPAGDMK
jgi:predicted sulfurtransferase